MQKRKPFFTQWRLYLVMAAATALIILVTFPRGDSSFKYSYQVGRPWMYESLISPIDFPILKTETERLSEIEEKADVVVSYFIFKEDVWENHGEELRGLLQDGGENSEYISSIYTSLSHIYDVGVIGGDGDIVSPVIIIQKGIRALEYPSSSVYTVKSAVRYVRQCLSENESIADSVEIFLSDFDLGEFVEPNLIYDKTKTEEIHLQSMERISPTKGVFYAGGLIVSEGEIVTEEIAQLLDSYKAEDSLSYTSDKHSVGLAGGRIMVSLILIAALFSVMYFTANRSRTRWKDVYFIITQLVLLSMLTALAYKLNPKMVYVIPYPVFALYLVSFYRPSMAFPVYSIILLPILLLIQNGVGIYFMNLIAGATTLVSFTYFNRGWHQFVNAFFIFVALLLSYLAFNLMWNGTVTSQFVSEGFRLILNALFVVLCYPLVFLFEKLFQLVSRQRLIDMADTNNKLLRELSLKAPGTFQHSLQVANLAGEVARELDVNEALVRAGALYHDIGKLNDPQCFVENQPAGINYHENLSPEESAGRIIRHVRDGVEMAVKNNLPDEVTAFIRTHHAQSMTGYFYAMYVQSGGDPENKFPFMYNGELPRTEEQVIVMMSDALEAASRTLKDYSRESISKLVESIVSARMADGMLVNADIPISHITGMKEIFVRHLTQIYHDRITYPKL